jgi:hypothetical protein
MCYDISIVQSGTAGILDTDHFEGILRSVRAASVQGCGLECLRCGKMIDHTVLFRSHTNITFGWGMLHT